MSLDQQEQQNFQDHLNQKAPGGVECPVCGRRDAYASDEVALPRLTDSNEPNQQSLYHVALLQCQNCLNIMFFGNDVLK